MPSTQELHSPYKIKLGKAHLIFQTRAPVLGHRHSTHKARPELPSKDSVPPQHLRQISDITDPSSLSGATLSSCGSSEHDEQSPVERSNGTHISERPPQLALPEKSLPLAPSFTASSFLNMAVYERIEPSPPSGPIHLAQFDDGDDEFHLTGKPLPSKMYCSTSKQALTTSGPNKDTVPVIRKDTSFDVQRVEIKYGTGVAGHLSAPRQNDLTNQSQNLTPQMTCKHNLKMIRMLRPHAVPAQMLCKCHISAQKLHSSPPQQPEENKQKDKTSLHTFFKQTVRHRFGNKSIDVAGSINEENTSPRSTITISQNRSNATQNTNESLNPSVSQKGKSFFDAQDDTCIAREESFQHSSGSLRVRPATADARPSAVVNSLQSDQRPFGSIPAAQHARLQGSANRYYRPATSAGAASSSRCPKPHMYRRDSETLPKIMAPPVVATAHEESLNEFETAQNASKSPSDSKPTLQVSTPTRSPDQERQTHCESDASPPKSTVESPDRNKIIIDYVQVSSTPPLRPLPQLPIKPASDVCEKHARKPSAEIVSEKPGTLSKTLADSKWAVISDSQTKSVKTHVIRSSPKTKLQPVLSIEVPSQAEAPRSSPVEPHADTKPQTTNLRSPTTPRSRRSHVRLDATSPRAERVRSMRQRDLEAYQAAHNRYAHIEPANVPACGTTRRRSSLTIAHRPGQANRVSKLISGSSRSNTTHKPCGTQTLSCSNVMVLVDSDPVTNHFRAGAISPISNAKRSPKKPRSKKIKRYSSKPSRRSVAAGQTSRIRLEPEESTCQNSENTAFGGIRRSWVRLEDDDHILGSTDEDSPVPSLHSKPRPVTKSSKRRRWNSVDIDQVEFLKEQMNECYQIIKLQEDRLRKQAEELQMMKRIMQPIHRARGVDYSPKTKREFAHDYMRGDSRFSQAFFDDRILQTSSSKLLGSETTTTESPRSSKNDNSDTATSDSNLHERSNPHTATTREPLMDPFEEDQIPARLAVRRSAATQPLRPDIPTRTSSNGGNNSPNNMIHRESGNVSSSESSIHHSSFPLPPSRESSRVSNNLFATDNRFSFLSDRQKLNNRDRDISYDHYYNSSDSSNGNSHGTSNSTTTTTTTGAGDERSNDGDYDHDECSTRTSVETHRIMNQDDGEDEQKKVGEVMFDVRDSGLSTTEQMDRVIDTLYDI